MAYSVSVGTINNGGGILATSGQTRCRSRDICFQATHRLRSASGIAATTGITCQKKLPTQNPASLTTYCAGSSPSTNQPRSTYTARDECTAPAEAYLQSTYYPIIRRGSGLAPQEDAVCDSQLRPHIQRSCAALTSLYVPGSRPPRS